MKKQFLVFMLGFLAILTSSTSHAQITRIPEEACVNIKWVDNNDKNCEDACADKNVEAYSSNKDKNNGSPFNICSSNSREVGYRPGWNKIGKPPVCSVSDKGVKNEKVFQCMCVDRLSCK